MLQEVNSRKKTIENFKEKADSVTKFVESESVIGLSDDIVARFEALLSYLGQTISTNEKCLENVQHFQNSVKQFRDDLKQNWEVLSEHTGRWDVLMELLKI